jgi:hypothetical protein
MLRTGKPAALALRENVKWRGAERLGRRLGRAIYSHYSELLRRGISDDRALALTKEWIAEL